MYKKFGWCFGVYFLGLSFLLTACPRSSDTGGNVADASEGDEPMEPDMPGDPQGPLFYFVLHADPAVGPTLQQNWSRLADFMSELDDRNSSLPAGGSPHRVTILFAPQWGQMMNADAEKRDLLASWIADGHEMGFHSHTSNHSKRDGYSNEPSWQKDDEGAPNQNGSLCTETDCSLDHGLSLVQEALDAAHGEPYDIKWARIGGEGNGGPECPAGTNDNSCDAAMDGTTPVADCCGCVDREWTGQVAQTIDYTTLGTIAHGEDADDPQTLLTSSSCKTWAGQTIYGLAHAPYETETGWRVRQLDVIEDAFAAASSTDHIGLVIHPGSFDADTRVSPPSRNISCSGDRCRCQGRPHPINAPTSSHSSMPHRALGSLR